MIIFGALLGVSAVFGGESDIPPQVIAVQPFPGEEMRLDTGLTIIFNQGMDRASVEAAFSLEPAVTGAFSWENDDKVTFTPDEGWQRDTSYKVTIADSAAAVNGLTLEEADTFTIRTVGRLEVTATIPENDVVGVVADATITISFNRPVVPLGSTEDLENLPNPMTIAPAVEGSGEWLNTSIYQFTPANPLDGGATYTVTVNAGLTDFTGASLESDYVFSFQTLLPEILSSYPSEGSGFVLLDDTLTVTFSQPMNQAATQESFTLFSFSEGTQVAGTFTWSEDGTTLRFTPDTSLTINTVYRLVINAAVAKGVGGGALRNGRDFQFATVPYPYVESTYPANGDQGITPGFSSVSIRFGTPMNQETYEGKYVVSPDPDEIMPYANNRGLSLEFQFQKNTTYTVTLLAGTEDIYGNAIASDYTFTFTTGELQPYIYLSDAGRFVVTGAYRQNTVVTADVVGSPEVTFELFTLPVTELRDAVWQIYDERVQQRLADPGKIIRQWKESFESELGYTTERINLASEDGGALLPGLYYLQATFIDRGNNRYVMPVALGVVNSSITYKRSNDDILIWVTDMQTGEPLPDQQITIYYNREAIANGTTDADGILRVRFDIPLNDQFISITSTSDDYFGVWYNANAPGSPPTEDVYVYTDRPIYRPGETLYYRLVYRARDDMNYSPGRREQVRVIISQNYSTPYLQETVVTLNEFGSYSGEFALPEDIPIGSIQVWVTPADESYSQLGSINAQIAEFRVPEFSVNVTPDVDEIIAGDPLRALINGTYFSGGAVSNANVTWYAEAYRTSFVYQGGGRYTFSDDIAYYFYSEVGYDSGYRYVADGSGITDGSGNFIVETENTVPNGPYPESVTIEATISDESGQFISNRSTVTIHPSEVYVGVRTDEYFGREGQPFTAEIITVTPQSDIVPNHDVDLSLVETRWERIPIEGQFGRYNWEQREIEHEKVRVTTDENGMASYEFTPPNAGIFMVRAETRDDRERLHRSSRQIWVTGQTYVWWGRPSNNIDLIADADLYKPGDMAQILVPVSLEGTSYLLISVERDGVMHYEIQQVEGSTFVYELPITEDHAPTIYMSVVVIHGIDDANSVPTYRTGTIALNVEPVHQRLDVTLTPSTPNAQPGDTVTIDIQATNPDGTPAQAEVGVAMVDAAILTLTTPNSADPEGHYYGGAGNYTYTDTMLTALIDGRLDDAFGEEREEAQAQDALGGADDAARDGAAPGAPAPTAESADFFAAEGAAGGGGGGFETVTVREDFQQTPLWEPHVVTDENGMAQVSVTLPDNLTIWDVEARAVTVQTRVGDDDIEIASTLPLLVRPAVPRFFVVGDEVTLAMVVNNNTGEAQTVNTTMQGTGFELIDGSELEQLVEIDANARARVEWRVKILDVSFVDLTFIALGEDGYQDAAKPALATGPNGTIPVYRYTAPDTTGTGGVLREEGSRTEGISIPPIADTDQGTLTIQLDPSLAVTTIDALDYLANYPHQCIEQTVSRFLPNVMTFRALRSLGVTDPELEADLREALDFGVERLTNTQKSDGGWGWFANMESHPLVTAYALLGLAEARNTGYDINTDMMSRAAAFLRGNFINPNEDTSPWQLNRQAFFAYVLSRYGNPAFNPSQAELDALYNVRLEMSIYAKAYLLSAYVDLYPGAGDQIASLTSDLITAAHLSATGAHWEEDYHDWWNWNTDIRSTAIVLSTLIKVDPANDLLPNAVRWLMVARQGDHWTTTQETAWSVMGLTDWMVSTNELQGNYDYSLALNGEGQTTGTVTPATVREGEQLVVQVGDLLLDEINRLTVIRGEGEGVLYYTAHLRLRLDASEVDAINRGVGITREYFVEGKDESVTEANMGDIITVRLTIFVPETIYYFVLEDPIPAGTEALDTSLLTTTQAVDGPQLVPQYHPYYYWYWWVWDHTEIRDEQVNLYADVLAPGTYVYSYQVQATVPGRFQTMPSYGYAFYFPELFGRSDGLLFTIHDPAEE